MEGLTFIARSPFVLVATSDGAGPMDISPKGDAPGFVRVGLPTLAETMKDAAATAAPVEALEGVIKDDEEQRLY
jgi:hypothetical protein